LLGDTVRSDVVGFEVTGLLLGVSVGLEISGLLLGDNVGSDVVGFEVTGLLLGVSVGLEVSGLFVGLFEIDTGCLDGSSVASLLEGEFVGPVDGPVVGLSVGLDDGLNVGPLEGEVEGLVDVALLGLSVGFCVGFPVNAMHVGVVRQSLPPPQLPPPVSLQNTGGSCGLPFPSSHSQQSASLTQASVG